MFVPTSAQNQRKTSVSAGRSNMQFNQTFSAWSLCIHYTALTIDQRSLSTPHPGSARPTQRSTAQSAPLSTVLGSVDNTWRVWMLKVSISSQYGLCFSKTSFEVRWKGVFILRTHCLEQTAANIRHQATKASFKTHLKTFLFSEFLARF